MRITILGGGIVGLTMANLLAPQTAWQIYIVEPRLPAIEWDANVYDLRCSAITPAVSNIFASLDIWQAITSERYGYYDQMVIWDRDLHHKVHFQAAAINVLNLGYIIENRILAKCLYKKLCQYTNVTFIDEAAQIFEDHADFIRISTSTQCLDSTLVIGADGANSWLRTQMQIPTLERDYQQQALVATIQTQIPHAHTAWQRFMPDGPLAFLPLDQDNLCSIVWSSTPEKIQRLLEMPEPDFCRQLATEFAFKLGALQLHGARASFPLRMLHATQYVRPRMVLIGDAAHVIHPMAGQGLNLGLQDSAVLAEILLQAKTQHQDIGATTVLRKYERRRKAENLRMSGVIESLQRSFASEHVLIKNLRGYSMDVLDNFALAKNAMMRFATGL